MNTSSSSRLISVADELCFAVRYRCDSWRHKGTLQDCSSNVCFCFLEPFSPQSHPCKKVAIQRCGSSLGGSEKARPNGLVQNDAIRVALRSWTLKKPTHGTPQNISACSATWVEFLRKEDFRSVARVYWGTLSLAGSPLPVL